MVVKLDMMAHKSGLVCVPNLLWHNLRGEMWIKILPENTFLHKTSKQKVDGVLQIKWRMWAVSHAWSWIEGSWKQKKLTHSCFSKEQTSSFIVFVWTARIVFFPIKEHRSLGTAGPATGRTINSLCQAPSQMVLTMSWRAFLSPHHLFKMLDGRTITEYM